MGVGEEIKLRKTFLVCILIFTLAGVIPQIILTFKWSIRLENMIYLSNYLFHVVSSFHVHCFQTTFRLSSGTFQSLSQEPKLGVSCVFLREED